MKPPVVTELDDKGLDQIGLFKDSLKVDPVTLAGLEAERLQPYLEAFSQQLREDIVTIADQKERQYLEALAQPESLVQIFKKVAAYTGNVILSTIAVVPARFKLTPSNMTNNFEGRPFYLNLDRAIELGGEYNTNYPIFGLDDFTLKGIADHAPQKMLEAFQAVVDSGNHDMVHHLINRVGFGNEYVITALNKDFKLLEWKVRSWASAFKLGSDTVLESDESWLLLNHARIWRILEKGPEGEKLKAACDVFFDELGRIGRRMKKHSLEEAHATVNYFGAALGFALMRFLPLTHPLMEHVILRMQEADPAPDMLTRKANDIIERVQENRTREIDPSQGGLVIQHCLHLRMTIDNYKAAGVDLVPEQPDYFALKRLQILQLSPWHAHLMSTAQPDSALDKVQKRVGELNAGMIDAVAASVRFSPVDGVRHVQVFKDKAVETYFKDQELSVIVDIDTDAQTSWGRQYKNGVLRRQMRLLGRPQMWHLEVEWFKGGKPQRKITIESTPDQPIKKLDGKLFRALCRGSKGPVK